MPACAGTARRRFFGSSVTGGDNKNRGGDIVFALAVKSAPSFFGVGNINHLM